MSKYTVELRWLIENNYDLGLITYPIFDETYRTALNNKIKEHFKYREIGYEVPGLFKDRLNQRMAEIMPLYNQYYKSALTEYDVFQTYNLNTVSNRLNKVTNKGTTDGNTSTITDNKNVQSDTPQGLLAMTDIESNV